MKEAVIRQRLYEYIRTADDRKVKALYTMLEGDIETVHNHWDSDAFLNVLDMRTAAYKKGSVKGIDWEAAREIITGELQNTDK